MKHILIASAILWSGIILRSQDRLDSASTYSGLAFRSIGPAFTSGRIADIALHPEDPHIWYVAVGSGGVWKTTNGGVTLEPIFDDQPSYSIGCVTVDPSDPHTVWVGTGENVGGRHVGYGDGIYKSTDGGAGWTRMGLKASEHISRIIVHPENSDVVYVAVQGPLWSSGGDRGLYRTVNGGESWERILHVNEWTGVTDLVLDPRDPSRIYAATWQRHRNVAAYMGGGPGSAIYRSDDGGGSWKKLTSGIPSSHLGKIGLAISPFDPDRVYAAIELDRRTGGLFMTVDRGETWKKQSDAVSGGTGPHYYQELYASPHQEGTIYLVDVRIQVSDDHGKTFRSMKEAYKHSDTHSISFRMDDPDYLLAGTDGGIYESFDLAENWRFIGNLPVTQYYKLAVDDSEPFYYIYGGTQDNGSHGGPSRNETSDGIRNADWFKILGADGHGVATEPGNPAIVYAETQQGGLHRIDRITGDQVFIQPQAGEGEPHERFNWDTPILVSPHDPATIYTGSYRVWRSEDRGDSWVAISEDLTRNRERLALPIMGRVQSWDNPWDLRAMSTYNTITSLSVSPLDRNLIYAGTDDGLIQVSEDGGDSWRKTEVGTIPGIPERAFVNDIRADLFDARTVYAVLDNHKFGDFTPYVIKSTDSGRNWISIAGNLPGRGIVWRLVQDHVKKELLFAATEFGICFTPDGGGRWIRLKGGVPTISFRDITLQRRENDLVGASFGRGFYVLDDISPLRLVTHELLEREAVLFPVRDAWWYVPDNLVSYQGASHYAAKNPPYGATFTYYLKEDLTSLKKERQKREKDLHAAGKRIPFPGWDSLEAEKNEDAPLLWVTISDEQGRLVNRVRAPGKKGIHRITWNLRHASAGPVSPDDESTAVQSRGFLATPGTYSVSLYRVSDGSVVRLTGPETFRVKPLEEGYLTGPGYAEMEEFRVELEKLREGIGAVSTTLDRTARRIESLKVAYYRMDRSEDRGLLGRIHEAGAQREQLERRMQGYRTREEVGEKQDPTPRTRYSVSARGLSTTYGPSTLHWQNLRLGLESLQSIRDDLKRLTGEVIPALEKELREAGAPWIEGQVLPEEAGRYPGRISRSSR